MPDLEEQVLQANAEGQVQRLVTVPEPVHDNAILRLMDKCIDKGYAPDQLEVLAKIFREERDHRYKAAHAAAKARFNVICPPIAKTKDFKTEKGAIIKYAGWDEIGPIVRPHLNECGIVPSWRNTEIKLVNLGTPEKPLWARFGSIVCLLTVGPWTEEYPFTGLRMPDPTMSATQADGAGHKYLQRYSFNSAMGLVVTDEDNEQYLLALDPVIDDDKRAELDEMLSTCWPSAGHQEKAMAWIRQAAKRDVPNTSELRESEYKRIIDDVKRRYKEKKGGKA